MTTLQEQYNSIKNGTGNKVQFLKQARSLFPQYLNQYSDFNTSVNVLKSKQIISEAIGGVVTKGFNITNWKQIFEAEVKAEEKETSKEVDGANKNAYDNKNVKNADNINFNEILKGYIAELGDVKNAGKTGDELKDIVVKNLSKDPLFYTKSGEFGIKGVGYTTEAPGLGKNTQPTSKNASILGGRDEVNSDSDVVKNSLVGSTKKNVKDTLSSSEAKTSMPKKVKEMTTTPQSSSGVKKMKMPGKGKTMKLQEGLSLAELLKESEEDVYDTKEKAEERAMQRSQFNQTEIYYVEEINGKYKVVESEYDYPPNGAYFQNGNRKGGSTTPAGSDPGNIEEKSMDLRTSEEKALADKIFPKRSEDLKNKYQDQQKNPNKSLFPKKESINSNLGEQKLRSIIAKLIKEELK